jgi:hypothetical protein
VGAFWERTTSDPVAFFTLVLAVSTIGLGLATICLYRAGNRQLNLARQEFIATHRPRVVVRFIQGPFHDENGFEFVSITLVNVGETKATIVAIGRDLARRKGRGGWLPPGLGADPMAVTPTVLVSGERFVMNATAKVATGEGEIFAAAMEESELCAVGCIQYRDGNGRLLETAFLRVESGANGFVPSKNAEDEYQD